MPKRDHTDPQTSRLLTASSGVMFLPFPIPVGLAYLGVKIQAQTAVLSAESNATGVVTSNGLELQIGY